MFLTDVFYSNRVTILIKKEYILGNGFWGIPILSIWLGERGNIFQPMLKGIFLLYHTKISKLYLYPGKFYLSSSIKFFISLKTQILWFLENWNNKIIIQIHFLLNNYFWNDYFSIDTKYLYKCFTYSPQNETKVCPLYQKFFYFL